MKSSIKIDPFIDMGLSVKWATCNLGSYSPEGIGNYYAWGEVKTKTEFSWHSYQWSKDENDTQTKYNTKSEFGIVDNRITLERTDDVAFMLFKGKCRIPSLQEWNELFENCKWHFGCLNNINGYLITSNINGGQLFLPFSGFRFNNSIGDIGKFGMYWTSSLNLDNPDQAWSADLGANAHIMFPNMRYRGYSIRPVIREHINTKQFPNHSQLRINISRLLDAYRLLPEKGLGAGGFRIEMRGYYIQVDDYSIDLSGEFVNMHGPFKNELRVCLGISSGEHEYVMSVYEKFWGMVDYQFIEKLLRDMVPKFNRWMEDGYCQDGIYHYQYSSRDRW